MRDVEDYLKKTKASAAPRAASAASRTQRPATRRAAVDDGTLYWPGGSGGGGQRRGGSRAGAVVRPHPRTSPSCKRCGQYHTTAEHARHAGGARTARAGKSGSPGKSKRGKAKKAKPKPRATGTGRRPHDGQLLELVRETVAATPRSRRYDVDDGVFVSEVYRQIGKRIGMSLPEFKHWLVEQNQAQRLQLVRLDLVDMVPKHVVEESEIRDHGASFHQIVDAARRD